MKHPANTPALEMPAASAAAGSSLEGNFAMSRKDLLKSPETQMLLALFVAAVLSLIFMQSLVAAPKVLFGRSLSAISPSLFPSIVLSLMALMCAGALLMIRSGVVAEQAERMVRAEWIRAVVMFGIMVLYALTMAPFGFLISTAIAVTLISLQMGAVHRCRSAWWRWWRRWRSISRRPSCSPSRCPNSTRSRWPTRASFLPNPLKQPVTSLPPFPNEPHHNVRRRLC